MSCDDDACNDDADACGGGARVRAHCAANLDSNSNGGAKAPLTEPHVCFVLMRVNSWRRGPLMTPLVVSAVP